MDFPSNKIQITFGDFDNLSQEDEVYQILYGPHPAESAGVEFPWSKMHYNYDESQDTGAEDLYENHVEEECYCGEPYLNQEDRSMLMRNPGGDESYYQDSNMDTDRSNNKSIKPYERRNKKRRPPGYYEKLKEEIEAERTAEKTQEKDDMYRYNTVPYEDVSYTSHSVRNTCPPGFQPKDSTNYAHNFTQPTLVQHQYDGGYQTTENVGRIAEGISHVTLSNDSLAHSHIVHTTHENYSHPIAFLTHSSQVPSYPLQTAVYSQQQWTAEDTAITTQNTYNTVPEIAHTSFVHLSEKQPDSGSISIEYVEVMPENFQGDVNNFVQNEKNASDNMEEEIENIVDFTSYPPLQTTANNIPIVASTNKQDDGDRNVEVTAIQDNSETQQEEPSIEQSGSVWGKPKSWANLFKNDSAASSVIYVNNDNCVDIDFPAINQENDAKNKQAVNMSPVTAIHDSAAEILGDLFCQYKIVHSQVGLQPRGLMNRGNWCYINATLQALISCPPFYNLMKKIPIYPPHKRGPTSTPILDSLVRFVAEFTPCARSNDRSKGKRVIQELLPGTVFEPTYVYKMLQLLQDTATFKLGRQEDAEEFLSCILDGMHEEMLACMRVFKGETTKEYETNGCLENNTEEDVDTDSWEQVGPKKKSVLTRKNDFEVSPLADIFVGYVRSAVFKTTSKDSATVEPFFTLKLDIQSDKVSTVREALERMVSKESVSGFTCSKTNAEMEVTKRMTLEQLPPVLILHLKCFVYDKDGGSQKLMKEVNFTIDLEITKDLLSPNVKTKYLQHQKLYKLFAVVYHHGKKVTGGHYTTAVFHPAINKWVHYDDSNVKIVHVTQVLQFSAPRVPYLLYYRRVDLH